MYQEDIVKSYSAQISRDHELAAEMRKSALSRLVWWVAIVGFVLLNVKPYWEAVRGKPLENYHVFWLSIPWAIVALLAIVTHILIDEWAAKDNVYFTCKQSTVELHKIDVSKGKIDPQEFNSLLYDTHDAIRPLKEDSDTWFALARLSERATHLAILVAFFTTPPLSAPLTTQWTHPPNR